MENLCHDDLNSERPFFGKLPFGVWEIHGNCFGNSVSGHSIKVLQRRSLSNAQSPLLSLGYYSHYCIKTASLYKKQTVRSAGHPKIQTKYVWSDVTNMRHSNRSRWTVENECLKTRPSIQKILLWDAKNKFSFLHSSTTQCCGLLKYESLSCPWIYKLTDYKEVLGTGETA